VAVSRLLLLGPPLVERDGRVISIKLRKALALAGYLAVERRGFLREHLAALLWPDLGQHSALANLRRMLTHLRATLGRRCISADGDLVQFDSAMVDSDVDEFQSLTGSVSGENCLVHLEAAAALYRGSFLEGFTLGDCLEFDDWQDGVRRRIEAQFDQLLETLCRGYLRAGHASSALPFALRWLELDQVNEVAQRVLMEIYVRTGRADLARRQFESCTRALAREGLEPEDETRGLYETITRRRQDAISVPLAVPARDAATAEAIIPRTLAPGSRRAFWIPGGAARRGRQRRLAALIAGSVVLATVAGLSLSRFSVFGRDLAVAAVETSRRGDELDYARIAFTKKGIILSKVMYQVAFASDDAVVAPRTYVVYEDEIRLRPKATIVEVDQWPDIEEYIGAHNVRIPPGNYFFAVTIDPLNRKGEYSEVNNRMTGRARFFFAGTAPDAAVTVDIASKGPGTPGPADPFKLYLGSGSSSLQREKRWARFTAAGEGTYYLPVEDMPERNPDGPGAVLVVIHDARGDLERPDFQGPGDVSAVFKGEEGRLSYGVFDVAAGTAVYPGRRYRIDFSPPAPPPPDAYEDDDFREVATTINYAALPVRQRHTFHGEGTGDTDRDCFTITLGAGDTLTVETFSAGGAWECDTAIDIADRRHYIRTANDKSELDLYSRLTYRNDTGADQQYYLEVKPWPKYGTGINRFADYIVEFRR